MTNFIEEIFLFCLIYLFAGNHYLIVLIRGKKTLSRQQADVFRFILFKKKNDNNKKIPVKNILGINTTHIIRKKTWHVTSKINRRGNAPKRIVQLNKKKGTRKILYNINN